MKTLSTLLAQGAAGVYRCHGQAGNVPPEALAPARLLSLRLHAVRDKNAFMKAVAAALAFPAYFGHNWDAFYDCMLDVERGDGLVIVFSEASAFARSDPEEFAAAIDTFVDAADFWKDEKKTLVVAFELDTPALAPDLPEVSCRAS